MLDPKTKQFLMQTLLHNIIGLQKDANETKSVYWRRRYLKLKREQTELLQSIIDGKPLPGPSIFDKPLFGQLFEEPLITRGFLTRLPREMKKMGYL